MKEYIKTSVITAVILLLSSSILAQNRAMDIMAEIKNPNSKKVLVASHRGDWRNHPENSLQAMNSAIEMGVDIVELDLALTKDSVLVICHDRTLDRTTNGKGRISEWTYDSISHLNLRAGHNALTQIKMPTLKEALMVCKDRAVVNIDKGYEYYDLVIAITDELGVTDQMLLKGHKPLDKCMEKINSYPNKMVYFPIVNFGKKNAKKLAKSYLESGITPLAYEVVWPEFTPEVKKTLKKIHEGGSKLWVNSLWASHNGGLCDDAAMYGDPKEVYGKLLKTTGASFIQTDRPQLLLEYLRSIGKHD